MTLEKSHKIQAANLMNQVETLTGELEETRRERDEIKSKLNNQVEKQNNTIKDLKKELQLLEENGSPRLPENSSESRIKLRQVEKKLLSVESELTKEREEKESVQRSLERFENENLRLKEKLSKLDKDVITLETNLNSHQSVRETYMRTSQLEKSRETSEILSLRATIDTLQHELDTATSTKDLKIKNLQKEIETLKGTIVNLEDEADRHKIDIEEIQDEHTQQMRRLIESHMIKVRDSGDARTLKITVELLQEEILRLKDEKKVYEERATAYLELRDISGRTKDELENERRTNEELMRSLVMLEHQNKQSLQLSEFYRSQVEEWKIVHAEQKDHFKRELSANLNQQKLKMHEMDMEIERVRSQLRNSEQARQEQLRNYQPEPQFHEYRTYERPSSSSMYRQMDVASDEEYLTESRGRPLTATSQDSRSFGSWMDMPIGGSQRIPTEIHLVKHYRS